MNRIIVALFALAFVQLVKGQENCSDAQTNLTSNNMCFSAIGMGTDVNTLCMGTCRYLIDAVVSYCNNSVAETYNTLIGTLCDRTGTGACETAFSSISGDCSNLISSSDNSVCTGTCASQVQDVVIDCGATLDPEILTLLSTYTAICSSVVNACLTAETALNANAACLSGINNNDTSILCFGACRTLVETYLAACGGDSQGFNQFCGPADCPSAISNITPTCLSYLEDVDTDVCSASYTETCRAQLQAAASVCTDLDSNPEAATILNQYNGVCSDACLSATSTLNNDVECTSAVSDDLTAVCRGTCRTLIMARFDVCPVGDDEKSLYKQLCGSGNMVMTSGITLLSAAICALVF